MNTKGQGSFEFVLVLGLMFFIILGSFAVIQARLNSVTNEHKSEILDELGNVVRTELSAAESFDGYYYREFILPQTAQGYPYNATVTALSEITLKIDEQEYVLFLNGNVTGRLTAGKNIVKKYPNGTITINL